MTFHEALPVYSRLIPALKAGYICKKEDGGLKPRLHYYARATCHQTMRRRLTVFVEPFSGGYAQLSFVYVLFQHLLDSLKIIGEHHLF